MNPETASKAWVAVCAHGDTATPLLAALREACVVARQIDACTELTHCSNADAPQAVILGLPTFTAAGGDCAQELPGEWDGPVIAVGRAGLADVAKLAMHLTDSGVHLWQASLAAADWAQLLAFAQAAHGRSQVHQQRISHLQEQLKEQSLVARAKGLLMAAQGMTEGEAFALLRSGAMHTRLPLADVARTVVDAAGGAEAVNRAGQLRWLSQRCIAAAAQRLVRIDPPAARKVQQEALKRARDILDGLARLPLLASARQALAQADADWQALKSCLDQRLDLQLLAAADTAAQAALASAELLTGALQAVGSSPMLRVVNLCGRQRMRAQRLVKLGLLARLGMASADTSEAPALMASFGDTLRELALLPLGSSEITAAHLLATERWRDMGQALQTDDTTALVHRGEALLDSVDALTHCWERSLQLLLG